MNKVSLLTGSNEGERLLNLKRARELIGNSIGMIIDKSQIYETEPWGYKSENYFLNQCLLIESKLNPLGVMAAILTIEMEMGRSRNKKDYSDRTIDIDILFFNDECIKIKDVVIPHPKLHERRFVLVPLCEIMPDFTHPVLGKRIQKILEDCSDKLVVRKLRI